ncbi:Protein kinase domain-containing protein [Aphelenchoides fujianensis]|nr:Protein kinase domain-containing protein [Aphelenchoides fujianensis]
MASDSDTDVEWPEEARSYEKERKLYSGSFATVRLVHVRGAVQQKAALKIVTLTGFYDGNWWRSEIRALQQLDHPNIVKCYASFTDRNAQKRQRLLLVLEYANRGTLERHITHTYFTKQRRLPEARIWRFFAQIATAIAHVHEKRILHRDLKPAHVLLHGPQLTVKVCDFAFCRFFSQNTVRDITQVGTPYYRCPERVTRSDYSFASDVWSMGCILYEMACGGSPFVAERSNEFALNLRIQAADFPPLPDHEQRTPHLKLLVRLCLQVDPGRRPTAAQAQRFADKMVASFSDTAAHLLRGASRACGYLDAVYRALHCDFARVWCEEYELMCADRCSFTSAALDDRE